MLAFPFTKDSNFSFTSNAPSGAGDPVFDLNANSYGADLIFGNGIRVVSKESGGMYFKVWSPAFVLFYRT